MNGKKSYCFWVLFLVLGFACFCQASLTDGLVAFYPFNGNTNDESGNGNHGTNYGATPVSDRFGKANSAFFFDGLTNYIDISSIASQLNGVRTGSISIWFKTDETVRSKFLFTYHKDTSSVSYIVLGHFTGYLSAESISATIIPSVSFGDIKGNDYYMDGIWHHALFVMGTNFNALYMDGEKVSLTYRHEPSVFTGDSNSGNILWTDIAGALIGKSITPGDSGYNFKGSMDDIRVYNRALSDEEINQIYTGTTPVPDTGQTTCYGVDGSVIACPSPGQALYGQDANYTINPISYTKLDGGGNVLPFSAMSWAMIRDNVTGLIWEVKTAKDDTPNYSDPHDADNIYTWYDSNPATNGGNEGTPGDGTDTEDFINALNNANYGGFSDWRLPTVKELAYIANYSIPYPGPTINNEYFPNTVSSHYWSSTTAAFNIVNAWDVMFTFGGYFYPSKSDSYYVRAVRGGKTDSGSYVDNGDGTVTDLSTGLMWQQASVSNKTWEQALAECEGLNLAGHTDWRLPNFKELTSLVDYSSYNPAINITYFPDTVSSSYWSSTSETGHNDSSWCVHFYGGNGYYGTSNKVITNYVRAVRGGQSISNPLLRAMINHNWIDGSSFPANTQVNVRINGGAKADFNITADSSGHFWAEGWNYWPDTSLSRGDQIQVSYDLQTLSMVVQNLTANVDIGQNKITGGAFSPAPDNLPLADRRVIVDISDSFGPSATGLYHGETLVQPDGSFEFNDLTSSGYQLAKGHAIFMTLFDASDGTHNGNRTCIAPYNGTPRLEIEFKNNFVHGSGFPYNTLLTLSINGDPNKTVEFQTDNGGYFGFNVWNFNNYPLAFGDAITATIPGAPSVSVTIPVLVVMLETATADPATNTVYGESPALSGKDMLVRITSTTGGYEETIPVGDDGSFSKVLGYDFVPGQRIYLGVTDDEGDIVFFDAYNGIPVLSAMIDHNWISGREFPPNTQLTINLSGGFNANFNIMADIRGNFFANNSLWNAQQLSRGDDIQVTWGDAGSAFMEIQNFQATVDIASNQVTGTAQTPAGQPLTGNRVELSVAVPGNPPFYVADPVTVNNGQFIFDFNGTAYTLQQGHQLFLTLYESADGSNSGNQTSTMPYNSIPYLQAMIDHNWIQCHNFPSNTNVNISLRGGRSADFSVTTDANGYFMALSSYWSGYQLQRGDTIQASYNSQQISMVIQDLNAVADSDTNLIIGKALTPGTGTPINGGGIGINVSQNFGPPFLYSGNTTTDSAGIFSLNTFADKGFDLLEGQKIFLTLTDLQGNLTSVAPYNGKHIFAVSLNDNTIQGLDFPVNAPLTLSINSNPALMAVITTDGGGSFNKNVNDFKYVLKVGDVVTIAYGAAIYGTAKVLTYTIPGLSATANASANTVSGVAPEYANQSIQIAIFSSGQLLYQTTVQVDSNGNFSTSLPSGAGSFDLVTGQAVVIAAIDAYAGITIFNGTPAITAGVHQINYQDVGLKTRFDITVWRDSYAVIDSITITGPNGPLPFTKDDFSHDPVNYPYDYTLDVDGSPEIGNYTFTVTSGSITATAQDIQTINREIPYPVLDLPTLNATLDSKTPVFSWNPVSYPALSIYYRLVIDDMTGLRVFSTTQNYGMYSCSVPENVLKPGQTYKYQVRASDAGTGEKVQNAGRSEWRTFTMETSFQHAAMPAIDLDGGGAWVLTRNNGNAVELWVKVIDHDGVAYDGSSHQVTASTPYGDKQLRFDSRDTAFSGYYYLYIDAPAMGLPAYPGDYVFTVTDPDGNTGSLADTLVVNPIPLADQNSFLPAFNAVVTDTTPSFSWDPVQGAKHYRVRIYSENPTNLISSGSAGAGTNSYAMPSGILQPNTAYRYRIDARDSHRFLDMSNVSKTPEYSSEFIRFTTGALDSSPSLTWDYLNAYTANTDQGATLNFFISVCDVQGVPENIQSVTVTLPDSSVINLSYRQDSRNTPFCGIYANTDVIPAPSSGAHTYIFHAIDLDNNSNSLSETMTANPIGYPAASSLSPVQGTVLPGTGVDFDWADVLDASFYTLQIYDENKSLLHRLYTTESSYHLPTGFLKKESLFHYRIVSLREFMDEMQRCDNISYMPGDFSEMIAFATAGWAPILSVIPTLIDVPEVNGASSFDISNTGTGAMPWTAEVTSGADWLQISSENSGTDSGTIFFDYSANTTPLSRTATIRVTASGAGGSPVDVTVTQAPAWIELPELYVSPFNQDVWEGTGETTFDVSNIGTGPMPWTAAVISGSGWLWISSGDIGTDTGTITCNFEPNYDLDPRTGTIQVTADGAIGSPVYVTVTQAPAPVQPVLSVSPSFRNVAKEAGTTTFDVSNSGTGSMPWHAYVWQSTGGEWLQIQSGSSGTDVGTITCTFSANTYTVARTATIQVVADGATGSPMNVTVTQAPMPVQPVLSVSPTAQNVAKEAGTTTFVVSNTGTGTGTMPWTAVVTTGNTWLQIQDPASGTDTGTITCVFSANTGTSARTATIQVTAAGATGSPMILTVIQAATPVLPVLSVSPTSQDVAKEAGNTTFSVSNTGTGSMPWTAVVTSEGTWLQIQGPASGTDTGTITCAFTANPGTSARTGTIQVTAVGATGSPAYVTVTQASVPSIFIELPAACLETYPVCAYRMIGIPVQCEDSDVFDTLKMFFGGDYNPAMWRLFRYTGVAYQEITGSGQDDVDFGKGWLMISNDEQLIEISGDIHATDFWINVDSGYNLLACPFQDKSVTWATVVNDNAPLQLGHILYSWDGSGNYVEAPSMVPGKAYFVWAKNGGSLLIQRTDGSGGRQGSSMEPPDARLAESKSSQPPPPQAPGAFIRITSPNGNEIWEGGRQQYKITWNSLGISPVGLDSNVEIALSLDGGNTYKILRRHYPNSGSFNWRIPGRIASDSCLIKITSLLYPNVSAVSETLFSIR
jgi:hypothetical protein